MQKVIKIKSFNLYHNVDENNFNKKKKKKETYLPGILGIDGAPQPLAVERPPYALGNSSLAPDASQTSDVDLRGYAEL